MYSQIAKNTDEEEIKACVYGGIGKTKRLKNACAETFILM